MGGGWLVDGDWNWMVNGWWMAGGARWVGDECGTVHGNDSGWISGC